MRLRAGAGGPANASPAGTAGSPAGGPATEAPGDAGEIAALLRRSVRGPVAIGLRRRAEYSSDASNYRVRPVAVVEPLDVDDVHAVLAVSRETGVPVTSRGGGTSIAGNAIGAGIVVDFSRHLNRVLEVDPGARTARVQPGATLSTLQRAAAPYGLRFGPDPSTADRATLGGMIGNNACGPHGVAYGRTSDNVVDLAVVEGRGRSFSSAAGFESVTGLADLVRGGRGEIRTELGRFPRQISGYGLQHLLPEHGRNLTAALVGCEGTVGVVTAATVRLVPITPARLLVVLGYPDMAAAADAAPGLLPHRPLAVEGLDARLVAAAGRVAGRLAPPPLPSGAGWLMVEVGGADRAEAALAARAIVHAAGALDSMVVPPGAVAAALWRIRTDGAGLAGRTPDNKPAWPGWEDAAVPPARLGDYLRAFESLLVDYGLSGVPYGHFGEGCVHVRIDFPLAGAADGAARFVDFVTDAARLVVRYGGSCSGEHGDGRARSALLPIMYSPRMLELFAGFKALFDPDDLLNPGILVRPRPIAENLRLAAARTVRAGAGGFAFTADGGDFTSAVHRCVGVGRCRSDPADSGGFMCPSYLATRDEKDVTRGRARVLQEVTTGGLPGRWQSPEVAESLDLCLSCKACASDCPAGVDLATYKSEVLHRTYRGRRRPVSHYTLGRLPSWLAGVRAASFSTTAGPAVLNAAMSGGALSRMLLRAGGIDPRRSVPRLAARSFRREWLRSPLAAGDSAGGPRVVLWADTFTDSFRPAAGLAAATVLRDAGYAVQVPDRRTCCGLTWITTGQLDGARRRLRTLVSVLGPAAAGGAAIVGLEPSCTAVLRSDLTELLPDDPAAAAVSRATLTVAELLAADRRPDPTWRPPDLAGHHLVVQPHCHQHAVLGFSADLSLLHSTGAEVRTVSGCCGLAGNFGMEKGHYELSVAVARNALLPALGARPAGSLVVADGFSCRTQIDDLAGLPAITLAELLLSPSTPRTA